MPTQKSTISENGYAGFPAIYDEAKLINADWFTNDLEVNKGAGVLRVTILLDTAAVVSLAIKRGATTKLMKLNNGVAIDAGVGKAYSMSVRSHDKLGAALVYNLRADAAVNVDACFVEEVLVG